MVVAFERGKDENDVRNGVGISLNNSLSLLRLFSSLDGAAVYPNDAIIFVGVITVGR